MWYQKVCALHTCECLALRLLSCTRLPVSLSLVLNMLHAALLRSYFL